jgi:hypothetical protein
MDYNEIAEKCGLGLKVKIDDELIHALAPSPYIAEMGITLDRRLFMLLDYVRSAIKTKDGCIRQLDESCRYFPFTVLTGPYVEEKMLFLSVSFARDGTDNNPVIHIRKMDDDTDKTIL